MPIYSYRCRGCGEVFDLLEGVSAEETRRRCPECSGKSLKKLHAGFNVGAPGRDRAPESCPICPAAGPAGCAGGTCPF